MDDKKHQKYLDLLEDYAKKQGTTLDVLIEKSAEMNYKEKMEDLYKWTTEYGCL